LGTIRGKGGSPILHMKAVFPREGEKSGYYPREKEKEGGGGKKGGDDIARRRNFLRGGDDHDGAASRKREEAIESYRITWGKGKKGGKGEKDRRKRHVRGGEIEKKDLSHNKGGKPAAEKRRCAADPGLEKEGEVSAIDESAEE